MTRDQKKVLTGLAAILGFKVVLVVSIKLTNNHYHKRMERQPA
jgi:hypothetical protein